MVGDRHSYTPHGKRIMNNTGEDELDRLRANYLACTGRPFQYFYCPILFHDDQVDLSRGHIINSTFAGSAPDWTIQRADVDNFFGSRFESDFVLLQHRRRHDLLDVLADTELSKKLRPQIIFKGEAIPHYKPTATVPAAHAHIVIELNGKRSVPLAIKLAPTDALAGLDADWSIEIEKDIRLAALVSLLKAAHLTMFDMLGYEYALSAGGYFLGHEILGKVLSSQPSERKTRSIARRADLLPRVCKPGPTDREGAGSLHWNDNR